MIDPHVTIAPSILSLGTPVVVIGTQNEDGTADLAPISAAWWSGWRRMLGLQTASKTPQNVIRTGRCVPDRPSPPRADAVNRLARLTGTKAIPDLKQRLGYAYEPAQFEVGGLPPLASQRSGRRAAACPTWIGLAATSSRSAEDRCR